MDRYFQISENSQYATAPNTAVAGIVTTHATTTLRATCHLTADKRLEDPTPKMLAVMAWVVLIGIPYLLAIRITAAPEVSAAKP